jgi:MFS family permease
MDFFVSRVSNHNQVRPNHRYYHLIQRRMTALDHLHPQRWNWQIITRPLDNSLDRGAEHPVMPQIRLGLRYLWLQGLFNAISDNFYLSFMPLFALAYGASAGQIGWLTAIANLLGVLALFPGARAIEYVGQRKPIVAWTAGGAGRLALLALACLPLFGFSPLVAIFAIIGLNGLRSFMDNFANPAWTALVADIVPDSIRGPYFSHRNIAMGLAALIIVPLAGWLIKMGNNASGFPLLGYQVIFFLAFSIGLVGTLTFQRIPEPPPASLATVKHRRGDLRRAIKKSPGFLGFVISAFVWNMAVQIAAPFFPMYLVNHLHASPAMVGILAGVTSLSALVGLRLFSRLVDKKGSLWVQGLSGLLIPILPLLWLGVTTPGQVLFIDMFGGVLWAGYNLANFNLLLALSPTEQRPRAVALYQTAVFGSAMIGPLLGGYLADHFGFHLIFGLSSIGRLAGVITFLWFTVYVITKRRTTQTQAASAT